MVAPILARVGLSLLNRWKKQREVEQELRKLTRTMMRGSIRYMHSIRAEVDPGDMRRLMADISEARRAIPEEIGKVHKEVGQFVIDRLEPRPTPLAVGSGRGAAVRPSATKREVILRAGGAHRASHAPQMQWGRQTVRLPGQPAPERPYIVRTAEKNEKEILEFYAKAVKRAADGAFDTSGM